jgi:hypothetical protein
MEDRVVNRKGEAVYVISNIDEAQIMSPVCREALYRKDHCRYVPVSMLGSYGKRKTDLLPYNWRDKNETVIVLDRSRLSEADKVNVSRLLYEMFPILKLNSNVSEAIIHAQKNTKEGKEFQVLLDIPEIKWLDQTVQDVWSIPASAEDKGDLWQKTIRNPIDRVAVLTNEDGLGEALLEPFRYGEKQSFTLDQYKDFVAQDHCTHKIIALNWNSETPCSAEIGNEILPQELREICDDSQTSRDRMGLTPWRRFCREADAKRFQVDQTEVWVLRAPTEKFLRELASPLISSKFNSERAEYSIPVTDLSVIKTLAIGTYIAPPDSEANTIKKLQKNLVLQQELESLSQKWLKSKVNPVSTQNWGNIIQVAMGEGASDSPFKSTAGAEKVVRAAKADALLVLWVRQVEPQINYSHVKERLTTPMPAFNQSDPFGKVGGRHGQIEFPAYDV